MRLRRLERIAWIVVVVVATSGHAHAEEADPGTGDTCSIDALPGLSSQHRRAMRNGGDPGRITDFWQVAFGVLGISESRSGDADDRHDVDHVGQPSLAELPCDNGVRVRDRLAWSMSLTGYSAREIADVVNGHLTRADLDQALARAMAGEPRPGVAAFLESRWREPRSNAASLSQPPASAHRVELTVGLEAQIALLSRQNHIEPALVRAVVAAESGGNARAVSSVGAIGLMQLMPPTTAALGVNPWNPVENLRGGITYLASLLKAYGTNVRLALIAYNAGPEHADRVRAGRAVAYRETREYLERVAALYPFP